MTKFFPMEVKKEILRYAQDDKLSWQIILNLSNFRLNVGQSLIELILAVALTSLLLPALIGGFIASKSSKAQETQRLQATSILKEAQEALRSIRERGWGNISTQGSYRVEVSGGQWVLIPDIDGELIDNYTRTIDIYNVSRGGSGEIVVSGGANDPSTKRAVIRVSWTNPSSANVESTIYLTRHLDNQVFIQPSPLPFSLGAPILTNVQITGSPERVELISTGFGRGDWCKANATSVFQLGLAGNGVAKAVWAIPGTAFAGTGNNASGLPLANITISDTVAPTDPTASVAWTYNPGGSTKTNDLFGDSTYSYLATDSNSEEVMVIANSTRSKVSSFNTAGPADANSIYVLNNIGYVVTGSNLFTFNMLPPVTGLNRANSSTTPLFGDASAVRVIQVPQGTYAFVTVNTTSNQLQIFKVNSLTSLTPITTFSVNGQGGQDVAISSDGTRAYLVTAGSSSQSEFFVIDTSSIFSTPSLSVITTFDTSGMSPRAVNLVLNNNRAIVVGTGGTNQYQVLNLQATPPTLCGYSSGFGTVYDVASVVEGDTDAWAYIVTSDSNAEFQIIEGGAGGALVTSGIYESGVFDTNSSTSVYNRLEATVSKPTGTNIKFKASVANEVSGSCSGVSNWTFHGPDNDPLTDDYFENTSFGSPLNIINPVALFNNLNYINPGRCFKYRAYLETSSSTSPPFGVSPSLTKMIINYTP